jgi:hypothetical protein
MLLSYLRIETLGNREQEDIGCSKIIYSNGVRLLWENPNCAHQLLRGIHRLHENLGSSLKEMAGKTTT